MMRLAYRCAACLVFSAGVCLAQATPASSDAEGAPVIIDGRVVLHVRARIKAASNEQRAEAIAERIRRFASDPYASAASITVTESDISSDIGSGDIILMSVFDADLLVGEYRQELAEQNAQQIMTAVERYRREHSSRNLATGAALAFLCTLVLIVAIIIVQRIYRRILEWFPGWAQKKIIPEKLKKLHLVQIDKVRALVVGTLRILRLAAVLVLLYFYVGLVFSFFPGTQGLSAQLLEYVVGPLRSLGQSLRVQVPKLFFILILVFIARYVLKLMRAFFVGIETGTFEISGFYREWAIPTFKILRVLIIAFTLTIAYPYIPGSGSDAFKGISIFFGLLLSLGSTSLVANIVAGLSMTYMRAFSVGDRVKIGEHFGEVIATRLQVTHIRTPKNEIVSVPNSKIISGEVMNFSALARDDGLIIHTTVGIGYDVPWRQVRAMLLLAAEKTPGLLREPPPFVFQKALGDFCVTYEINAYTSDVARIGMLYSDLHKNILDLFNEYQVQIMTPNYEGDPKAPAVVPKENWYAAPAKEGEGAD
jgi:small-conductance mechanosensitive channel